MLGLAFFRRVFPKNFARLARNQIIPTLGTKHSHVGNEIFPRVGIKFFLRNKGELKQEKSRFSSSKTPFYL
jgi:hypothetical protein